MQRLTEKLVVPLPELLIEEENHLDLKIQIDIAKIYTETKQFSKALQVIDEIIDRDDAREFQKRELLRMAEQSMRVTRFRTSSQNYLVIKT